MGGGAAFSPAAAQTGEGRGASRSGGPGGAGARGRAAGTRAEAARGGRSGGKRRPRRCSSVPASAAPKSRWKKAGKEEGRTEKLTGDSI